MLATDLLTKDQIDRVLQFKTHHLFLAHNLEDASDMLGATLEELKQAHPNANFIAIEPDDNKNSIGIDKVKQYAWLGSRKGNKDRYVISIQNAGLLTVEAQNSLLKILEQAQDSVMFLLSVKASQDVLPTVASRMEVISYKLAPTDELSASEQKLLRASAYSSSRLTTHKTDESLQLAKQWLTSTPVDRIGLTGTIKTSKQAIKLLDDICLLLYSLLIEASNSKDSTKVSRYITQLETVQTIITQLKSNASVKLCLNQTAIAI